MKRKLDGLEGFLKDYGLKWTGDKEKRVDASSVNVEALKRDLSAREIYRNKLPETIDMNKVKRAIDWLNHQVIHLLKATFNRNRLNQEDQASKKKGRSKPTSGYSLLSLYF